MKTIEIDDATYGVLQFAARVAGRSPAELISRLVAETADLPPSRDIASQTRAESPHLADMTDEVPIYANYLGKRIDAVLDPIRETVRVTSGPLAGELFSSPSAAGIKLVETMNPKRQFANTNGWRFWRLTSNKQLIDTLRRVR